MTTIINESVNILIRRLKGAIFVVNSRIAQIPEEKKLRVGLGWEEGKTRAMSS